MQLVLLIFPEFKTIVKQMIGKTARFILKSYTTPGKIGALDKQVTGEGIRKWSWGILGMKDAELFINAAQQTIGIKEGVAGIVLGIKHIIAQPDIIDRFTADIEAEMTM
jgi:hypothetical protein